MTASLAQGRIFINYRREDTDFPAGWLYERLVKRFGERHIFKDVDSIQLGDDFVDVITEAVGSCDVLLAVIGDQWLTVVDQDGRRRLDSPDDFVRLEIEAALARNVRVIPILVEGARMPHAEELPDSLAKLARRQALELSPARFDGDTRRLMDVLDRTITEIRAQSTDVDGPASDPAPVPVPSPSPPASTPPAYSGANDSGAPAPSCAGHRAQGRHGTAAVAFRVVARPGGAARGGGRGRPHAPAQPADDGRRPRAEGHAAAHRHHRAGDRLRGRRRVLREEP